MANIQRASFKLEDNNRNIIEQFDFSINPQNIQEQYTARNNFAQTMTTQAMQGYGQGMHTIVISGTVGYNPRFTSSGNTVSNNSDFGLEKLEALRSVILQQVNTAHDANLGNADNATTLIFCNYGSNESWVVEMDSNAIQINRSTDDPLSYYYTISMVALASYDTPKPKEVTSLALGNQTLTLATRSLNDKQIINGKNVLQALFSVPIRPKLEMDTKNFTESSSINRNKQVNVNSLEAKYSINGSGNFALHQILPQYTIQELYSLLYTDATRKIHFNYQGTNLMDIVIDNNNPAWNSYWKRFISESNKNNGSNFNGYSSKDDDNPLVINTYDNKKNTQNVLNKISTFTSDQQKYLTNILKTDLSTAILNYGEIDLYESLNTVSQATLQDGYRKFFVIQSGDESLDKFIRLQDLYNLAQQYGDYGITPYMPDSDYIIIPRDKMAALYQCIYGVGMNDNEYTQYLKYGSSYSDGNYNAYDFQNQNNPNGTSHELQLSQFDSDSLSNFNRTVVDKTIFNDEYLNNQGIGSLKSGKYLNPLVSREAPRYANYEIDNILQF